MQLWGTAPPTGHKKQWGGGGGRDATEIAVPFNHSLQIAVSFNHWPLFVETTNSLPLPESPGMRRGLGGRPSPFICSGVRRKSEMAGISHLHWAKVITCSSYFRQHLSSKRKHRAGNLDVLFC